MLIGVCCGGEGHAKPYVLGHLVPCARPPCLVRAAVLLDANCAVIVVPDAATKSRLTDALSTAASTASTATTGKRGGGGSRHHDPTPWRCPLVVTADALMALPVGPVPDVPDNTGSEVHDLGVGPGGGREVQVFYTSGSTGVPKGCRVSAAALVSYCIGKNAACDVTPASVVFVASPPTFDPSVGDFIATWVAGGTVAISSAAATYGDLAGCMATSTSL